MMHSITRDRAKTDNGAKYTGIRRRVSILRALLADSDCVIMDEPLRGLDEKTRIKTIDYILKKTEGKTLIFVTHEEQEAVWLKADKTLKFMKDHLIKWSGK